MAKLSIDQKPRRARVSEDVRNIRTRFAEAQRLGYSNEEAAKLAHGAGPINPPGHAPVPTVAQPKPQITDSAIGGEATAPQAVRLSGGGAQPESTTPDVEIPPTWQDLPWPQLKVLAESLNGGRDVKSRKQAGAIIERALQEQ